MCEELKEGTKLCFRCEYRAQAHETGSGPRYECKELDRSVWTCYMFTPVYPIILERNKGDKRFKGGGLLGARMHGVGVYRDLDKVLIRHKRGRVVKMLLPKESKTDE